MKICHIWKRNAGIGVFSEDSSSNMWFLGMRIILANLCDWNTMMNYVNLFQQTEYKRGVSSWNFNVEDLKAQAALVSVL